MENARSGLHPLLTAAAISVTVFSAVGVATLTGLVPSSIGSQKDAPVVLEAAPALPAEPAQEKPAKKPAV